MIRTAKAAGFLIEHQTVNHDLDTRSPHPVLNATSTGP